MLSPFALSPPSLTLFCFKGENCFVLGTIKWALDKYKQILLITKINQGSSYKGSTIPGLKDNLPSNYRSHFPPDCLGFNP